MPPVDLTLSLQFALRQQPELAARHRAALPRAQVARAIRHALQAGGQGHPAEFTVRIVNAEEGLSLNRDYRQKSYATNVLTFDYSQQPVVAADLVLCAPVVESEAEQQGKTLRAHYQHLLVHGALHALGYDHDISEQDAEQMEELEIAIMQQLGYPNPYLQS
jgi:probable rRNA maturation factor